MVVIRTQIDFCRKWLRTDDIRLPATIVCTYVIDVADTCYVAAARVFSGESNDPFCLLRRSHLVHTHPLVVVYPMTWWSPTDLERRGQPGRMRTRENGSALGSLRRATRL